MVARLSDWTKTVREASALATREALPRQPARRGAKAGHGCLGEARKLAPLSLAGFCIEPGKLVKGVITCLPCFSGKGIFVPPWKVRVFLSHHKQSCFVLSEHALRHEHSGATRQVPELWPAAAGG